MLFSDPFGHALKVPTTSVSPGLRPSSAVGLRYQTPTTQKGVSLPSEVVDKLESIWEGLPTFEYFPAAPPRLMFYLYSTDELGNTAVRQGSLIDVAPLEPEVQGAKYWLSGHGLRYTLQQTFTYAGMSDVAQGGQQPWQLQPQLPDEVGRVRPAR